MGKPFKLDVPEGLVFRGDSELLAQVTQELTTCPGSCFTQNVLAWYNSLYSELSSFEDCRYQVEINQELCDCDLGDSTEDAVAALMAIVDGKPRRIAQVLIRVACREALRQVVSNTSQSV
jgi:hypothetical protein